MTSHHGGPPYRGPTGQDDISDHFDTDTLADFAEGLLEGARDAHVRAHLDWCTECGGTVEQLRSVQTVLSSLPEPAIPADVAERIDATLARAHTERTELSRDEQPAAGRRRSWFAALFGGRPQLVAGAAVLVVAVAFLGGYASTRLGSDGASNGDQTRQAVPPRANEPMITGRDYSTDQLAGQARALAAQKKQQRYTPDPADKAKIDAELRRLSDPDELEKCVNAITGGKPARIVAVDLAALDDDPAAIVLMTMSGKPDKYEVAAVGPGCTAGDAKMIMQRVISKN